MAYDITDAHFAAHQKLKNDALDLKDLDKSKADNVSKIMITADGGFAASTTFFNSKVMCTIF